MTKETGGLEIMPARPEHAAAAAELIHASGPKIHERMYVGDREFALRTIAKIFRAPDALVCFSNATAACADGRVKGLMIAYEKKHERTQGLRYFRLVFRLLPLHRFPMALIHMLLMRYMIRPIGEKSLFLAAVAVSADSRGAGIGFALMKALIEDARRRGLNQIEADVEIDNQAAIDFYRRFGFQITRMRRAGFFRRILGFIGYYRIVFRMES